jgi:hypothetical protein
MSGRRESAPVPNQPKKSHVTPFDVNARRRMERRLTKLDRLQVNLCKRTCQISLGNMQRQSTYHDREATLSHLAGIFRTKDNHFHTLKVDLDRGCTHALGEVVGGELTRVVANSSSVGSDEHVISFLKAEAHAEIAALGPPEFQVQARGDRRAPHGCSIAPPWEEGHVQQFYLLRIMRPPRACHLDGSGLLYREGCKSS